jgi:hypothetical protein
MVSYILTPSTWSSLVHQIAPLGISYSANRPIPWRELILFENLKRIGIYTFVYCEIIYKLFHRSILFIIKLLKIKLFIKSTNII